MELNDFEMIINLLSYSENYEFTEEEKLFIVDEIMNPNKKKERKEQTRDFTIFGITYKSEKIAQKALGLSDHYFCKLKKEQGLIKPRDFSITYENVVYQNVKEFARINNLSPHYAKKILKKE